MWDLPNVAKQNSTKLLNLTGGVAEISNSDKYDLSGDFTIEGFFRASITETLKTMVHKMDVSGKGFKIEMNKATNLISFEVGDGTNVVSGSFTPVVNLDDNIGRHFALVVDRANDGAARVSPKIQGVSALRVIEPICPLADGDTPLSGCIHPSLLRDDLDHAVRRLCAVERRCGRPFDDLEALDVVRVEVSQSTDHSGPVSLVLRTGILLIIHAHAVHIDQWPVAQ